ncbi:MAG: methylenetetrahydrofolate reductase [NAD(P)H] [Acidobacteria bacterium]|nr:methylenetetrahydrofolate reductase [NAD(P)H] [Acidobacteriota bacterium]MBI3657889.1 methylenetetrahydrofolate reductase [NAD(P)H] [Acidobacteriota bacterium]
MQIKHMFKSGKPLFSFEFFPPKNDEGMINLYATVAALVQLNPSFVSVTYGAGGSTRERTVDLVSRIKNEIGLETMAHLTCVGASRMEIAQVLDRLQASGIENVLPLRGDPPKGEEKFVAPIDGFSYASDLARFVHTNYSFCLGGACYPEGHVECQDRQRDLENLKIKVAAGIDFLITQLFFDNKDYFEFVDRARKTGISLPIIAGIMPITNVAQIKRFTNMCGSTIPTQLLNRLEKVQDNEAAVLEVGIEHATQQCRELLESGAPGIHFYTLNKSPATRTIFKNLKLAGYV